ncbi:restriction endonuclease subunit S [Collinsella ihumii]|uniref:Restriction endonuclease subunit S n=1 Tax=Collinsella ihumii TaxID=1720204 RepID=A0AAW7JQ92_9ACTN|nr:restriction endonuclease subunit S [Collinsella ihumii]MDN0069718.1 restriction endonuclease subunit S [Collinsella ihumii]
METFCLVTPGNATNDYLFELTNALLAKEVYDGEPFGKTTVRNFTISMSNGATPSRKIDAFWAKGTIPWVKTGEVHNNLIFGTDECITELALERTSARLLPKDTLVMALYGSGTAGRVALLQTPATTNQACTAMICETPVRAFYLFVTLQGIYRKIDALTRGSVQQNLSKDIVADLDIPNIDEMVLERLGLPCIYEQIVANAKESLHLAEVRDELLPKLISGQIDVSNLCVL